MVNHLICLHRLTLFYLTECPYGSYGWNCKLSCVSGYYGRLCSFPCECVFSECHHATGCIKTDGIYNSPMFRFIISFDLFLRP